MKKITNFKLKIINISLSFFIIYHLAFIIHIQAAESTPSATALSASSMSDKIHDLQKEIASKAAEIKSTISQKLQNKVYSGVIQSLSDDEINLITKNGNQSILTNEYTDFEQIIVPKSGTKGKNPSLNKTKISQKDLNNQDFIIGLGDLNDQGKLVAKKILKLPAPKPQNKIAVWGQIQSINPPSLTIKTKEGNLEKIITSQSTSFAAGNEEANFQDLKVTKFILSSVVKDNSDNLTASYVYLIPSPETPIAQKSATPSASSTK